MTLLLFANRTMETQNIQKNIEKDEEKRLQAALVSEQVCNQLNLGRMTRRLSVTLHCGKIPIFHAYEI